jgi:hypothetical protein
MRNPIQCIRSDGSAGCPRMRAKTRSTRSRKRPRKRCLRLEGARLGASPAEAPQGFRIEGQARTVARAKRTPAQDNLRRPAGSGSRRGSCSVRKTATSLPPSSTTWPSARARTAQSRSPVRRTPSVAHPAATARVILEAASVQVGVRARPGAAARGQATTACPASGSAPRSALRELMSSFSNTLRRWYSTVRGLMNSWAPISGLVCPSPAR